MDWDIDLTAYPETLTRSEMHDILDGAGVSIFDENYFRCDCDVWSDDPIYRDDLLAWLGICI